MRTKTIETRWNECEKYLHIIHFPLSLSSKPLFQAEFYYIEKSLFAELRNSPKRFVVHLILIFFFGWLHESPFVIWSSPKDFSVVFSFPFVNFVIDLVHFLVFCHPVYELILFESKKLQTNSSLLITFQQPKFKHAVNIQS